MLRNSCVSPGFDGLDREADLARFCAQRSASSPRRIATTLATAWDALREGLSAYREYELLKSGGLPHDPALRAALGIRRPAGDARSPTRRHCPRTGGPRSGETVVRGGQDVAGPRDATAARPGPAGIGNLAYVA
jgi:hypothetical protein